MFEIFKKPLSRIVGATFAFAGVTLLACAMENGVAMAEGPTFQDVASQVFGQPVGPDNDGTLYIFGLTAKYTEPEYVDGRGPYKSFFEDVTVNSLVRSGTLLDKWKPDRRGVQERRMRIVPYSTNSDDCERLEAKFAWQQGHKERDWHKEGWKTG